jgi:hypothetical protein
MDVYDFFANVNNALRKNYIVSLPQVQHFLCRGPGVQVTVAEKCFINNKFSSVKFTLKQHYQLMLQEFLLCALFFLRDAEEYPENNGSVDFIDYFSYVFLATNELACYVYLKQQGEISEVNQKNSYPWDGDRDIIRKLIKAQLTKLAAQKKLLDLAEKIYIEECVLDVIQKKVAVDIHLQEVMESRQLLMQSIFVLVVLGFSESESNRACKYIVENDYTESAIKARLLNYYNNSAKTCNGILHDTYTQLGIKSYAGMAASYAAGWCLAPLGGAVVNVAILGYMAYRYHQQSFFNRRTILKLIENILKDWEYTKNIECLSSENDIYKLHFMAHYVHLKKGIFPPDITIFEFIKLRVVQLKELSELVQPNLSSKLIKKFIAQESEAKNTPYEDSAQIPNILFLPKHIQDNLGSNSTSELKPQNKIKTCREKQPIEQAYQKEVKTNSIQITDSDIHYVTMNNHATVAFQFEANAEKFIPQELNERAQGYHQQTFVQLFLEGEFDRILRPRAQYGGFKKLVSGDAYELKAFYGVDVRLIFEFAGPTKLPVLPGSRRLFAQTCPLYIYKGCNMTHS